MRSVVLTLTMALTIALGINKVVELTSQTNPTSQTKDYQMDDAVARTREHNLDHEDQTTETSCKAPTKAEFVSCVRFMMSEENTTIIHKRLSLVRMSMAAELGTVSAWRDVEWLMKLSAEYGTGDMDELLRRVDSVPVDLGVAQAILESGWGQSHAAREGNSYFGQIRAGQKPDTPTSWGTTKESVHAYVMNLNTHPAYAAFRHRRQETHDAWTLAGTLTKYSVRGVDYTRQIQGIVRDLEK